MLPTGMAPGIDSRLVTALQRIAFSVYSSRYVIPLQMAPYPSGKGEVCKTFMNRFDSDRRLSTKSPAVAGLLVFKADRSRREDAPRDRESMSDPGARADMDVGESVFPGPESRATIPSPAIAGIQSFPNGTRSEATYGEGRRVDSPGRRKEVGFRKCPGHCAII